jgi:Protein of unknown function (DUF1214)
MPPHQSTNPFTHEQRYPRKNKAINPINGLSPFFGAAALVLTFVLAPIPIDTAQAQQSATAIIARMKRIDIEPGKSFDADKADPAVKKTLERVPQGAQELMRWKIASLARVVNGWSMNTDTMGVYGNYYLKRAIIAQLGLGANLPEDAIYPMNLGDESGKPLDGANKYTIHFDKATIPPANAFWSITLYDEEGFQVANSLNRFAVSSWMPFQYSPGRVARPLFSEREPRCRQGGQLASRSQGVLQPLHAPLCSEVRSADWQVESAAGHEGSGAPDLSNAVKARESRHYSVAILAY